MSILRHLLSLERPAARAGGWHRRWREPEVSSPIVDRLRSRHRTHATGRVQPSLPRMKGRLARAEAECLPFPDATFDACYSIGGFTYYDDHAAAFREMRRVTRAAGRSSSPTRPRACIGRASAI